MAKKISLSSLQPYEHRLPYFARALDYNLASWLLSPQTKEKLFAEDPKTKDLLHTPQMPTEKGSVLILFERSLDFFPQYIAEGFALPFCWQQDPAGQAQLPEAIRKEAEKIRHHILEQSKPSQEEWYLSFAEELAHLDLSDFPLKAESAALPLAASLLLTIRGGHPGTTVLSTGAINDEGYLESVDGYASKIEAATLLFPPPITPSEDAKPPPRIFFLPPADFSKAKEHAEKAKIRIETLAANEPVWKQLDKLLVELDQPPDKKASLDTHLSYANRQHMISNTTKRSEHYKEYIVQALGKEIQPKDFFRPERLLLPVSLFPDNAMLSLAALQPKEVCFVTSRGSEKHREALSNLAKKLGVEVHQDLGCIEIEDREITKDDIQKFAKWLSKAKEGAVVDFTPGTREMLAACLLAGLQSHAKIVYVRHSCLPKTNTIQYGTEEFVQIDASSVFAQESRT